MTGAHERTYMRASVWLQSGSQGGSRHWSASLAQSCPTLCDPTHCSPPGSSGHGIFQARALEREATPFSRALVRGINKRLGINKEREITPKCIMQSLCIYIKLPMDRTYFYVQVNPTFAPLSPAFLLTSCSLSSPTSWVRRLRQEKQKDSK